MITSTSLWRSFAVVLGTLSATALTTPSASAQTINPSNPTIYQTVAGNPPVTTWEIQAVGNITGIPANKPYNITIYFEKRAAGGNWGSFMQTGAFGTAPAGGGQVNYDTGHKLLSPPPASGDEYRVTVSASYTGANGLPVAITPVTSGSVKPIP